MHFAISRSPAQWKQQLGAQRYAILREAGTERAFHQPAAMTEHRKGVFVCAGCALPLFSSLEGKYDSGTGWPSFTKPLEKENVKPERSGLLLGGFLGSRGPLGARARLAPRPRLQRRAGPPGHLRYCMNGLGAAVFGPA